MARKHLFRGFHPDENGTTTITLNGEQIKGEWIEGDLIENQGDYYIYHANSDNTWIRVCHENEIVVCACKVLFETVEEFTSLTDKNVKKIFEHDIIKVTYQYNRSYQGVNYTDELVTFIEEVIYDRKRACFMLKIDDYGIKLCRPMFDIDNTVHIKEYEVIGNIFENPELLEMKE